MNWRRSLGLAMISFGVFLVVVTIRHLVRESSLLLIQPLLAGVLLVNGWGLLGLDPESLARRWSDAVAAVRARSQALVLAGATVLLVVLVAVVALGRSDDYPPEVRDEYIASCAEGHEEWEPLCTCTLEHLESNVDYERYRRLDTSGREVDDQPPELQNALTACVSEEDVPLPDRLLRELDQLR